MIQQSIKIFIGLILFIVFSASQSAAGQNSFTEIIWTEDAKQPYFVSEAQSTVVGGKLYSFGGFDSIKQSQGMYTPTRRAYVYDPALKAWSPINEMPYGLTHAGLTNDGVNIYYAGGYIENSSQTGQVFGTKQVWRYNVATNDYTALPNLPIDRSAGQLAYVDSKLYYMGGTNRARNEDTPNVYMLDLGNLDAGWVEKAPLPNPRHHAGAVVYEGKIYYVGGQKKHDGDLIPQNSLHQYDPTTDTWIELAPMPGVGRNHASSTTLLYGKRILVLAGQTDADIPTNTVFAYDLQTNTWTELAPLPIIQHSGIGGVIDGVIYFGMGAVGGDNKKMLRRGVPVIVDDATPTATDSIPATTVTIVYTDTPLFTSTPTSQPPNTLEPVETTVPTNTAVIVPTAEDTPSSGIELVVNGGFESNLEGWKLKRETGDKLKCNKPEKTYEGLCFFQFKGGVGENSVLMQSINPEGRAFRAGDTLQFRFYVNAKATAAGKVMLKVNYADAEKEKQELPLTATSGYESRTITITLQTANVTRIKAQIKHTGPQGKVRLDGVSLRWTETLLMLP